MKATIRIPLDQYAFIELQYDKEVIDTHSLINEYRGVIATFKGGSGLDPKLYNKFIDRMLLGESNHIDEYNQMTQQQQETVQTIKRALKRVKEKHEPQG